MSTVTAEHDPHRSDSHTELKILGVIGTGHFVSHYYYMCLPPIF